MITSQLISPKSIAIIGASENTSKPGGKVLQNILEGKFKGPVYAVNKKPIDIKGVIYVSEIEQIEQVDLAIISIPASQCLEAIQKLLNKGAKAFIIYSAGFSEAGEEGIAIEKEIVALINKNNATLIGPNCIGVINDVYKGMFTTPVPNYDK